MVSTGEESVTVVSTGKGGVTMLVELNGALPWSVVVKGALPWWVQLNGRYDVASYPPTPHNPLTLDPPPPPPHRLVAVCTLKDKGKQKQ